MNRNNLLISFLIVVRNGENVIEQCIKSILNQDLEKTSYEIIIIDGLSDDRTVNTAINFMNSNGYKNYRVITNTKKNLASGWNLGIVHSLGEYVLRVDAHAQLRQNYASTCIKFINEDKNIMCCGGKLNIKKDNNPFSKQIISLVYSSKFAIGNAIYRFGNRNQIVDTVAYGVYKRKVYDLVGSYDETLERNQDIDFHRRFQKKGYYIYFTPDTFSEYIPRVSVKKMILKSFFDGYWVAKTLTSCKIRHLIPLIFLLSIILLLVLSLVKIEFLWVLILLIMAHMFSSIYYNYRLDKSPINLIVMHSITIIVHLTYGIGTMIGIVDNIKIKKEEQC